MDDIEIYAVTFCIVIIRERLLTKRNRKQLQRYKKKKKIPTLIKWTIINHFITHSHCNSNSGIKVDQFLYNRRLDSFRSSSQRRYKYTCKTTVEETLSIISENINDYIRSFYFTETRCTSFPSNSRWVQFDQLLTNSIHFPVAVSSLSIRLYTLCSITRDFSKIYRASDLIKLLLFI